MEWLSDAGVSAGAVVAIATAATLLFTKVVRPIWRGWTETVERIRVLHELTEVELRPNGGSSIRDRVAATDTKVDDMADDLADSIAVAKHHIEASSSALFDISTAMGDLNRQLQQHVNDGDVHMRRNVYSAEEREVARQMLDDARSMRQGDDDG